MANVLTSFLVGIGFQADEGSARQVGGTLDRLAAHAKSAFGAIGVGLGLKQFLDSAKAIDAMTKAADRYGLRVGVFEAMGRVFQKHGGSLSEVEGLLGSIRDLQTVEKIGDAKLYGDTGILGLDPYAIRNASTPLEGLINLLSQVGRLGDDDQNNAANIFGLQNPAMALARSGDIRGQLEYELGLRDISTEFGKKSSELQDALQDLTTVTKAMLDPMTEWVAGISTLLAKGVTAHIISDANGPVGLQGLTTEAETARDRVLSKINRSGQYGALLHGPITEEDVSAEQARMDARSNGESKPIINNIYLGGEKIHTFITNSIERYNNLHQQELVGSKASG